MTLPDDIDQYEQQFQNVDEKTILIWQLAELSAIRRALEGAQGGSESVDVVVCRECHTEVEVSQMPAHAQSEHGAPKGVDVSHLYEEP